MKTTIWFLQSSLNTLVGLALLPVSGRRARVLYFSSRRARVPVLLSLAIGLLCTPASGQQQDALESIESTRTGRHWVDAKPEPPKTPEESLKCFQIEPGVTIELVAAEPLVIDPVAITFDRKGRMFVVEYRDYPTGPPQEGDPPLSRVVMLEDTDGDGVMDRRHVFADHLKFVHSLMAFKDGILVAPYDKIVFL